MILVCRALGSMPVYSATSLNPEEHHFIALWGTMAYHGLMTDAQEAKLLSGFSPSLGVGYRFHLNNFIMQVGAEAQYSWNTHPMPTIVQEQTMYDADLNQEEFKLIATLFDRKDVYHLVSVNIPVLFGYERERFYALAGAEAGLQVYGVATSTALLTSTGEYERYIGLFENMPNHGLLTHPVESGKKQYSTGLNLLLHLEAGARVDRYSRKKGFHVKPHMHRMYVGAFAQYGVLDIHGNKPLGDQMALDFTSGVSANILPVLISNQTAGKTVHPFTVGVKFTALLELPQKGKSYIYDYNRVSTNYRKRGGNQSIQ